MTMTEPRGLVLPAYFSHYRMPVKLVRTSEGGAAAWRFCHDTGGWEARNDLIDELLFATTQEVDPLTREGFVQRTEWARGRYLGGAGSVFALYETIAAIEESAAAERRRLTDVERELVRGLRRKTFVMFEEELQRRGEPGADPSLAE